MSLPEAVVPAVPVNDPSRPPSAPPPVYAASAELLDTVGGRLTTGRFFDARHDGRADRVAVIGARAAEQLGVQRVAVIVLLAGGVGIANVTMLSVMERMGEIGLRRATGAALGVFAAVVISVLRNWTPVVDPWIAVGGALLGAVVGLVAGGLPARRAARIGPVVALRGGT